MPAADSRPTFRMNRSILSHDAVTCGGSPEVSSTAFDAQPPDLPPVCLVDTGFAVLCQLAPHRRPHHPVLVHRLASLIHASFRPRLATTPLRFSSPSPPPGRAGDFHPLAVEHVRHTKREPQARLAARMGADKLLGSDLDSGRFFSQRCDVLTPLRSGCNDSHLLPVVWKFTSAFQTGDIGSG